MGKRLLIAGIDPGVNVGVALLDLDGNIVLLESMKSPARGDVIKRITSCGNVFAVSTDKKMVSKLIKSIASSISAELILPRRNLTKKKKRILIEEFLKKDIKIDSHEKSALASAIYAYKRFIPKIKKLRDKIKDKEKIKSVRDEFVLNNLKISEIEN
ncbi:MAG TPA: DUF460 domain-containing protein [Candidatus Aenigmarchaeota archaeon]|nr:DUF460 domain-containing protein [Candidatus Aenigmarchaeota archaeon]